MAEPEHKSSSAQSPNDNVGSVVGNSVVNDLMRVYENLTQSSTPQAGVPDASKALSLAYNNSRAPQPVMSPVYPPPVPPGYSIPPDAFQQQQQQQPRTKNPLQISPLQIKSEAAAPTIPPSYNIHGGVAGSNMTSSQHQQPTGIPGYVQGVMGTATSITIPVPNANNDGDNHRTQQSGEESHAIPRTYSSASRMSQNSTQNQQQPGADASSESDKSGGGGGGRSRRKRKQGQNDGGSATATGGGGGKKSGRGKKSKKEDGRWSKRFTWPEDLHRDFVSAIFDVGLKHSSPVTIMEHMPKHEQITTERIKSHLQKYRLHRVKSKKEFISSYEASLRTLQQSQSMVSGGAEVAAHLTAATLIHNKATAGTGSKEDATNSPLATILSADHNQNQKQERLHQSQNTSDDNDSLMLPQLTEEEKASPIGAAMGYLMGLFFSLKQQLIIQRSLEAAGEKAKGNALAMASSGNSNINMNTAANNPTTAATAAAVAARVDLAADGSMQQSQHQNGTGVGSTSVRSNIEVNSMMKREMQNQMALQNKMRALKQQELDKYKNINKGSGAAHVTTLDTDMNEAAQYRTHPHFGEAAMDTTPLEGTFAAGVGTSEQQPPTAAVGTGAVTQGAGEMAGTDLSAPVAHGHGYGHTREGSNSNSNHLLGIDSSEDFWNTDVVDDQLFEFLMNS